MNYRTNGIIELNGMHFHSNHGCLPEERRDGAEYLVDFKCTHDVWNAMNYDQLSDTIDYARVYDLVAAEMAVPSNLLEHVAGRIVHSIRNAFPDLEHFSVKVTKLNPPTAGPTDSSSVTIEI
ncbi:MAG: dihydroneopterin aldolase [Bacteroidales bacterium]|nr:dihydroneopterin aldolase [Bacteroidales bacterium]